MDGVEWLLELQAKLDGATRMVQALTGVEDAVGKTHRKIQKLEHEGGGALHHLADWMKDFGKAAAATFTGMFAAEAVWDSLKEGAVLIKDLVGEMFEAAAEGERTRLAFTNMLGEDAGRELLENLDRFSGASEFNRMQTKGFAQSLLDAGFAGHQLNMAMSAVTDVAARSPNKIAGAENAIAALSRVMLTGTLDARALRMLKLSPKAVFEQMSKDLGMGLADVKKKLEQGKLKPEDVLNSVFKALAAKGGGTLGKVGAEMANSFQARWEKLKATLPSIFEALNESPGFKAFSDTLGKIVEDFAPEGPAGKAIIDGLGAALTYVGNEVKGIDWKTGIRELSEFIRDDALPIVKALTWAFKETYREAHEVAEFVMFLKTGKTEAERKMAADVARTNAEIAADKAAQMATLPTQGPQAGDAFVKVGGRWIPRAQANLFQGVPGGGLEPPAALARPAEQRFTQGASGKWMLNPEAAGSAGEAIGEALGAGIPTGAQKGLGVNSPSSEFEWLGEMSRKGFEQGMMTPASAGARAAFAGVGAGGRGPVTITAPINVSVAGGSEASAEEIAEAIKVQVPSAILAALEQLGMVGGTA